METFIYKLSHFQLNKITNKIKIWQIHIHLNNLILGDELFLYVKAGTGDTYSPIAYSTSCSLNLSQDAIDTSNKMAGVWASALPGKLQWTVSTESLMSYDETGYGFFVDMMAFT